MALLEPALAGGLERASMRLEVSDGAGEAIG